MIPIHPELDGRLTTEQPNDFVVYFIIRGGQVVYIGSTAGIPWERIDTHRRDPMKVFDAVYYLQCPGIGRRGLRALEKQWIGILRPVHNRQHNPSYDPRQPSWGATLPNQSRMSGRLVRLPEYLVIELEQMAEDNFTTFRTQVIFAVKAYLEHKRSRKAAGAVG